jgi:hypothetical protein
VHQVDSLVPEKLGEAYYGRHKTDQEAQLIAQVLDPAELPHRHDYHIDAGRL